MTDLDQHLHAHYLFLRGRQWNVWQSSATGHRRRLVNALRDLGFVHLARRCDVGEWLPPDEFVNRLNDHLHEHLHEHRVAGTP